MRVFVIILPLILPGRILSQSVEGGIQPVIHIFSPDNSIIVDSSIPGRVGLMLNVDYQSPDVFGADLMSISGNYFTVVNQCYNRSTSDSMNWRPSGADEVIYACSSGLVDCRIGFPLPMSVSSMELIGVPGFWGGYYIHFVEVYPPDNTLRKGYSDVNYSYTGAYICVR